MKGAAWLVIFAAIAPAVAAAPLEVRGVQLGSDAVTVKASLPSAVCNVDACYVGKSAPVAERQFGLAVANGMLFILQDGRVGSILVELSSGDVAGTVATLTEKYGPPTDRAVEPLKNRMGVTFNNERVTWRLPDGTIESQQRYKTVDAGQIQFSAPGYAEWVAARMAARRKAAASKL